jgi:hypothetical protein
VPLSSVRESWTELLRAEVAGAYLAWMDANARAVSDDAPGVTIEIAGGTFTQRPQRYAAKAYAELHRKRSLISNDALSALLGETGCDAFLLSDAGGDEESDETEASDA